MKVGIIKGTQIGVLIGLDCYNNSYYNWNYKWY